MPMKEDVLKTKTYKDQGLDVDVRVLYTLNQGSKLASEMSQVERNSRAISHLFKTLVDAGTLKHDQLDDILLHVV